MLQCKKHLVMFGDRIRYINIEVLKFKKSVCRYLIKVEKFFCNEISVC